MGAHSTNDVSTFIEVADDCPIDVAQEPPLKATPTVAELHYAMMAAEPYRHTSDDVIFTTHAVRSDIPASERAAAREAYYSVGRACLRSSPLGKRYGWGIHHDESGRVAVYPRESEEYARLAADPALSHLKAMRSRRA